VFDQSESGNRIEDAIGELDLRADEKQRLLKRIPKGTEGLLIYGSRARGDHISTSDFDLLRFSRAPYLTFNVGRVSVSSYSEEQLLSASGTLFGTHILRDGKIIFDPKGELARILGVLKPANPDDLISTVRRYSTILDQPVREKIAHTAGLVRLARYLLRTAVYAKSMFSGPPCFSVRELAERFSDPALATLLASDPQLTGEPSLELLDDLTNRLVEITGPLPKSGYGSISAIAVGMWDTDRNLAALAIRAKSEDRIMLAYTELPKVLL
jgi:hypothetical protein